MGAKRSSSAPEVSERQFTTIETLAGRWHIVDKTVRRMIERGDLPITRLPRSKKILIDMADVERIEAEGRVDVRAVG